MNTYSILFLVIAIMHSITLVNITFFDGAWNGIVLLLSNILFVVGLIYFGAERQARKSQTVTTNEEKK